MLISYTWQQPRGNTPSQSAWSEDWQPFSTVLHSSNTPCELSKWLCHDDSTIHIVCGISIGILSRHVLFTLLNLYTWLIRTSLNRTLAHCARTPTRICLMPSPATVMYHITSFRLSITSDCYVSHHLLPPQSQGSQNYNLRQRLHSFTLPFRTGHLTDRNFMQRMLYLNSY